jgi:hypothetical protein
MEGSAEMKQIGKQKAGFRFGKYPLMARETLGEVGFDGRRYRILRVITEDNKKSISIRLYNRQRKFIKQLLIEPEVASPIGQLLIEISLGKGGLHGEVGDRETEKDRPHLLSRIYGIQTGVEEGR